MTDDNLHKLSLSESFERVAKVAEERAKIVAYARGHGGNAWSRDVLYFAEKVEAGEHLKEQSK